MLKEMRELTLKRFFLGEASAEDLALDVSGSIVHLDSVCSSVQIEDMDEEFEVCRDHVMKLCRAALSEAVPPESLTTIAFALMASDTFYWNDEVISEVVADWSAPEINYPLTAKTLAMHESWLTGAITPPERPAKTAPSHSKLVSRTTKARLLRCLPG